MKWFNIEGFMSYMKESFPTVFDNHFTYDLLENLLYYLIEQFDDNRELACTITEIVPEITEEEVLKFCAK